MLDETEHFISEAKKHLEKSNYSSAQITATLALVHVVNQLNETLKAKSVAQKTDRQQE